MALTQAHFRFGIDELAESTHGWLAAEDVNPAPGSIALDTTFLLRFAVFADAAAGANTAPQFEYSKNGGAFTAITTSSTNVRAVAAAAFANADNTTRRLTTQGTTDASNQGCTEDGLSGGAQMDIPASGACETECGLQLRSADLVNGDVLTLRVSNGGVAFASYPVTATYILPLVPAAAPAESSKIAEVLFVALAMIAPALMTEPIKVADEVQAALVSTDLSQTVSVEAFKADDGGRVDLIGFGNAIKCVDGPVIAALVGEDLLANVTPESLKVIDSILGPTLDPEEVSLVESLKVVDEPPVALRGELLTVVVDQESLKVVDALSLTLNPEQSSPSEALKADDGGFVELIGLGNPIRCVDGPVNAQLVESGLSITVAAENVKVADVVLTLLNPEEATINESLKVVDSVLGPTLNPEETTPVESLKVVDTVQAALDIMQASATESLKVADAVFVTLNPEQAIPSEALKVADSVSTLLDPEQATPVESLKVVDAASLTLNPEETALAEGLKIVDAPSVTLNPEQASPAESLKVIDTVQAARVDAGSLAATLADENVKVIDAVQTLLNPEQATPSEALKVVDALTVAINLSASLTENIKVGDEGEVELSRDETIKIGEALTVTITPIFALPAVEALTVVDSIAVSTGPATSISESLKVADFVIVSLVGGDLSASPSESLKVVDSVQASVGSLFVGLTENVKVADTGQVELVYFETIKIADTVIASMGAAGNDLSVSTSESLKVADSVQVALQLAVILTESLSVVDQVSTIPQLAIAVTNDALKVVDTVSATLQLGVQVADEGLKVVDGTPVGRLDPLQVLITESLKVVDVDPSITTGTTIAVIASETFKITDAPAASIDPELAAISEALTVTDAVFATLDPEQVALSESLACVDIVQASLDVLNVSMSEGLKVADSLSVGGPTVIEVVGSYVTVIDVAGSYGTAIDIVGERI